MLAWVMNLGFAASGSGVPAVTKVYEQKLGLSLIKLGGTVSLLLVWML